MRGKTRNRDFHWMVTPLWLSMASSNRRKLLMSNGKHQLVKIIKGVTILGKGLLGAIPLVGPLAAEILGEISPIIESKLTDKDKAKVEEKITNSDETIRHDPNSAEAHYTRGIARLLLKQYEMAIIDFDMVIDLEPDFAKAYNLRGAAKFEAKKYEESLIDFNQAIRLKPDFAFAYYNRGL